MLSACSVGDRAPWVLLFITNFWWDPQWVPNNDFDLNSAFSYMAFVLEGRSSTNTFKAGGEWPVISMRYNWWQVLLAEFP